MKERRFKIRLGRLKGGLMLIPGLTVSWAGEGMVVSITWLQFFVDTLCKYHVKEITLGRRERRALRKVK